MELILWVYDCLDDGVATDLASCNPILVGNNHAILG